MGAYFQLGCLSTPLNFRKPTDISLLWFGVIYNRKIKETSVGKLRAALEKRVELNLVKLLFFHHHVHV